MPSILHFNTSMLVRTAQSKLVETRLFLHLVYHRFTERDIHPSHLLISEELTIAATLLWDVPGMLTDLFPALLHPNEQDCSLLPELLLSLTRPGSVHTCVTLLRINRRHCVCHVQALHSWGTAPPQWRHSASTPSSGSRLLLVTLRFSLRWQHIFQVSLHLP